MTTTPLIVFLDLDGTLVGDVSPLICHWELTKRYNPKGLKYVKNDIITYLRYGFLRPSISSFLDTLSSKNVEVFIYTAAEKGWVDFLVPCIEAIVPIKFNRPIFTRKDCTVINKDYKKSLMKVLPRVHKTIMKKYEKVSYHSLFDKITLVDNNNVIMKEEIKKWIMCPTYSFRAEYDVLKSLSEEVILKHYVDVSKVLSAYGLYPQVKPASYEEFKYTFFERLQSNTTNNKFMEKLNDRYFKELDSLFTKINIQANLSNQSIHYINRKLSKLYSNVNP